MRFKEEFSRIDLHRRRPHLISCSGFGLTLMLSPKNTGYMRVLGSAPVAFSSRYGSCGNKRRADVFQKRFKWKLCYSLIKCAIRCPQQGSEVHPHPCPEKRQTIHTNFHTKDQTASVLDPSDHFCPCLSLQFGGFHPAAVISAVLP